MTQLLQNKNTTNFIDNIELRKSNKDYKYYRRGKSIMKVDGNYENGVYELINSRTRQVIGLGLIVHGELYHAL